MATGSGLVALVAARAGAAHVDAADIDPFAEAAVRMNAHANHQHVTFVRRDLLEDAPPAVDVLLAADTWYEGPLADRILPWLRAGGRRRHHRPRRRPGSRLPPRPGRGRLRAPRPVRRPDDDDARGSRGRRRVRVPRAPDVIVPAARIGNGRHRPPAQRLPCPPPTRCPTSCSTASAASGRPATSRSASATSCSSSAASVPATMLIGCSDSRSGPEVVFDALPGELFVVRNVGGLVPVYAPDTRSHAASAALEYAVLELGVTSIVVMGHGRCGGVAAALGDGAPLSSTRLHRLLDAGPARPRRRPRARRLDGPGRAPTARWSSGRSSSRSSTSRPSRGSGRASARGRSAPRRLVRHRPRRAPTRCRRPAGPRSPDVRCRTCRLTAIDRPTPVPIDQTPEWQALLAHHAAVRDVHLRDLFADDPERATRFTAEGASLFLDYSKHRITDETDATCCCAVAKAAGVEERRTAMFAGRAHQRHRGPRGPPHRPAPARERHPPRRRPGRGRDVHEVLDRMAAFALRVRGGDWTGSTGKRDPQRHQHRHRRQRPRAGDGDPGARPLQRALDALPVRVQHRRHRHPGCDRRPRPRGDAVHRREQDVHDPRDADQRPDGARLAARGPRGRRRGRGEALRRRVHQRRAGAPRSASTPPTCSGSGTGSAAATRWTRRSGCA